jgi:hypothetical protein
MGDLPSRKATPRAKGKGDVPALIRRVTGSIENLGDVQVQDITFSSEVTDDEDDLRMNVMLVVPRSFAIRGR